MSGVKGIQGNNSCWGFENPNLTVKLTQDPQKSGLVHARGATWVHNHVDQLRQSTSDQLPSHWWFERFGGSGVSSFKNQGFNSPNQAKPRTKEYLIQTGDIGDGHTTPFSVCVCVCELRDLEPPTAGCPFGCPLDQPAKCNPHDLEHLGRGQKSICSDSASYY